MTLTAATSDDDATTQTWWLSFCDSERPTGEQFLGVAIVDVTAAEAARAKALIDMQFPQHQPGAEWIAAATQKAWAMGCNPGGEVGSARIDDAPTFAEMNASCPRNRLLSKAELTVLGHL